MASTARFNNENLTNQGKRTLRSNTTRNVLGNIGNKIGFNQQPLVKHEKDAGLKMPVALRKPKILPRHQAKEEPMQTDPPAAPVVPTFKKAVLPPGVRDIDAEDSDNPQLCADYAPDIYKYMRQIEKNTAIRKNFLQGCYVNSKMRSILVDWLVEVQVQFKLLQETLYITGSIIDRFLQVEGALVKRNRLQLIGVTAMFIASKVEEMYAPEINDFVYITDNAYSSAEIREMELRILKRLNFAVSRPIPLHFLRRYSKAGDVDVTMHTAAKYFLELCLIEYELSWHLPSELGAAALFLAIALFEPDVKLSSVWGVSLTYYSGYGSAHLLPIVCRMAKLVKEAPTSKWQSVYKKFSGRKCLKVSTLPEMSGRILTCLADKQLADL